MIFCGKDRLIEVFKGKSVAIVGSGPGALENRKRFVDSHDIVVRVNNYKLFDETGRRTDVFYSYFGNSIKKTEEQLKKDGVYLCMSKCPDAKVIESDWHVRHRKLNGIDFRYIYEHRKSWWFCETYMTEKEEFIEVFNLLDQHIATTGFSALYSILKCDPSKVYLTGFDFFQSKIHNVNERWRKINNDDPISHKPDLEKAWIKDNLFNFPIELDSTLRKIMT